MPDIVVTSFSHEVTAITLQGTVLWQWNNDDTIVSGAVVATSAATAPPTSSSAATAAPALIISKGDGSTS